MCKIIAHKKAPLPENKEAKNSNSKEVGCAAFYFIIVSAMPNKLGSTMKSAKKARTSTRATV